jgi:ankyrin repeat protein
MYAVAYNNTLLALKLADKGADVNVADFKQRKPLHLSVLNDVRCTRHFLILGADINHQDRDNITERSMAIEHIRIHIIILVGNCAGVNLGNDYANTALHVAVAYGDLALVQYLVDRGADVNIPNNSRNTPLHWILLRGWDSLAAHLTPHELSLKIDTPLQVELLATAGLRPKTGPVMQTPL